MAFRGPLECRICMVRRPYKRGFLHKYVDLRVKIRGSPVGICAEVGLVSLFRS